MSSDPPPRGRVPMRHALLTLALPLALPSGAPGAETPDAEDPDARPPAALDCSGRDGRDAVVGDGEDGEDGGDCGDDEPPEPAR